MTRDMALLILGLLPGATAEDANKAFKQKASQWHPDRYGGHDPSKNGIMRELLEAKRVLVEGENSPPPPPPVQEQEDADDVFEIDWDYINGVIGKKKRKAAPKPQRHEVVHMCRGYTAKGDPCLRIAAKGNYGFCHIHR